MKLPYYIRLLLFSVSITVAGIIIIKIVPLNLHVSDVLIQSSGFGFIALCTLIIFFRGQEKEPAGQTMHSLVAISFKLLLEMLFALIWFILAKKNSLELVLLFFVLYLAFTLYSVFIILKTLKNKSLDNNIGLENV